MATLQGLWTKERYVRQICELVYNAVKANILLVACSMVVGLFLKKMSHCLCYAYSVNTGLFFGKYPNMRNI